MKKEKIRLKIKKDVKYSICTCGFSKKLPFCDNEHRSYNKKNNTIYKSIKVKSSNNTNIVFSSSNWDIDNE